MSKTCIDLDWSNVYYMKLSRFHFPPFQDVANLVIVHNFSPLILVRISSIWISANYALFRFPRIFFKYLVHLTFPYETCYRVSVCLVFKEDNGDTSMLFIICSVLIHIAWVIPALLISFLCDLTAIFSIRFARFWSQTQYIQLFHKLSEYC